MSQNDKIVEYMQEHGSITPLEAIKACGCLRLSGRIFELKRRGYKIKTSKVAVLKADGSTAHIARYRLEEA